MACATAQCRLPDRLDELLNEAADQRDVFRSEIVRRALRYYIGANPDKVEAFRGVHAPSVRGVDPVNTVDAGREGTTDQQVYDPTEEGR